jgi:transcriptional regulator with PAS, ATPase and Fis domain
MDFVFPVCHLEDDLSKVIDKMASYNTTYIIVLDKNNSYLGILSSLTLIKNRKESYVARKLIRNVAPALESDDISSIKNRKEEIIPVVNIDGCALGVVNLKSFLEYIPTDKIKKSANRQSSLESFAKYSIDDIIGESKNVISVKEKIIIAAKTKSTVLISGETGTGKELIAHAIHRLSNRRHYPFIRINCAAIPEPLLESELFGYEHGSFTGAAKGGYVGKFQLANKGSVFLDEIGDMPLSLQAKILRVLQENEIEKIGGVSPIPINVRIIAATHQDLKKLIAENKFRQDLFYRLYVFPIEAPSLVSCLEDLPVFVQSFVEKISRELGVLPPQIEKSFLEPLYKYHWPGNIRELMNVIESAICLCGEGQALKSEHIYSHIIEEADHMNKPDKLLLQNKTDEAQKLAIVDALKEFNWDVKEVIKYLGISKSSFYNKIKRYNIKTN